MFKIFIILLSAASGVGFSFLFANNINNIPLLVLIGFGMMIATLLSLIILFFVLLFIFTFFENKNKERNYQSVYFRKILILMDKLLFALFSMKIHFSGRELLSRNEQYIIVCNHRSNVDSLVIDYYLKNFPLVFITKDSLFNVPFVGQIIHGCAYLKIYRDNIQSEFDMFSRANEMLIRSDKPLSIGVFPEGTRNKNNDVSELLEFKAGTFRMAFKSKKPIVIMALKGTKEVNEKLLFKRHNIFLDILEVIEFDQYKDLSVNEISSYCQNKISQYLKEKN